MAETHTQERARKQAAICLSVWSFRSLFSLPSHTQSRLLPVKTGSAPLAARPFGFDRDKHA